MPIAILQREFSDLLDAVLDCFAANALFNIVPQPQLFCVIRLQICLVANLRTCLHAVPCRALYMYSSASHISKNLFLC